MIARALFPGSFDPVTNGHMDVIERALGVFPNLVVAIAKDSSKNCLFTGDERVELMKAACKGLGSRVSVVGFHGLLVDYMLSQEMQVIVRGLRAVADYEYEVQMAQLNRHLSEKIDTLFLAAGERSSYVSSSLIKQVAKLGGDVSAMVPAAVAEALEEKFRK